MGIALGCIGLSYDDFCRMDFEEFASVHQAYTEQRDTDFKDAWMRMRMLATITLQPHLNKGQRLSPEKLLPLPWDRKPQKPSIKEELTPEQRRQRMREMVEKLGDKI